MNAKFITGSTKTEQDLQTKKWYTMHNQLFLDENEEICLSPRNEETDGYSYPTGGRMAQWDIRPAIGHDFECKYHQRIIVNLSFYELVQMGFIKNKAIDDKGILVCKDIPTEYLTIKKTTFLETNARFKRMMEACGISAFWYNTMWLAVHLNIGWLSSGKKPFNIKNIYKK